MQKKQLEQARRNFTGGQSTQSLRTAVQADLAVVKSAYDLAEQFMTKIEMLLANVEHDDKPAKALKELAGAYKDTAFTMVAMRTEARASIAHARAPRAEPAQPAVPAESQPVALVQAVTPERVRAALPAFTPAECDAPVPTVVNGCAGLGPAGLECEPAEPAEPEACAECDAPAVHCTCVRVVVL